jgi:alcohol dehydrogenase
MVRGFLFSSPGKIVFEPNGLQKVADEIKALGGKNPLLVTDKGVKNSGTLKRLQDPMITAGIPSAIFDEVESNLTQAWRLGKRAVPFSKRRDVTH